MCAVKKPKIKEDPNASKPLPVLRNPFLDGLLGNVAALRNGRNALRINLLNPLAIPVGGDLTGVTSGGSSGGVGSSTGVSTSGGGSSTGGSTSGGGSGGGGGWGGGGGSLQQNLAL